jgi:hypothetical protein
MRVQTTVGAERMAAKNPVQTLPPRYTQQGGSADGFGDEMNSVESDPKQSAYPSKSSAVPPREGASPAERKSRVPQTRKRSKYSRRNIALANANSKNKLFRIVHPLHLAVVIFHLVAIGVICGAVATTNWYVVTDGANVVRQGLFQQCVEKPQALPCTTISFGISSSVCNRTSSEVKAINTVSRALSFSGLALSVICCIIAVIARPIAQAPLSVALIVTAFLSLGCYAAVLGVFVYHKERWEFCDRNFCSFLQAQTGRSVQGCQASFGYSTALVAIAVGAAVLGFLFALFRFIFREWNIQEDTQTNIASEDISPKNRPRSATLNEGTYNEVSGEREPFPPALDIPPPPEGDWVFDEECGMYWSEQEFLFMDPYTQHSYDPNSDMWYDPDAEEWYQGEEIGGETQNPVE